MKKLLLLFPLVALLLAVGCKKIDKLLTFYIEDSQNIRIASNFPVGALVPLTPITVPTQSEAKFSNEGTRADLVKNVSLDRLTLTITDPSNQNFDFLRRIELYISTDQNDQVLLASLSPVPTGVSSITLTPSGAVLDKYLKASSYTLTTKAEIARPVSRDITVRADSRFKVTADPL